MSDVLSGLKPQLLWKYFEQICRIPHGSGHEKALALPIVSIVSDIPQPEEDRQDYCYPGLFERAAGYTPAHFYTLEAPSHKGHSWTRTLTLPWRKNNSYPEVEQSFQRLRNALEAEIEQADNSQPMSVTGSVQTSAAAKVMLAPNLLAERLLRLAANAGSPCV